MRQTGFKAELQGPFTLLTTAQFRSTIALRHVPAMERSRITSRSCVASRRPASVTSTLQPDVSRNSILSSPAKSRNPVNHSPFHKRATPKASGRTVLEQIRIRFSLTQRASSIRHGNRFR